jgi:hypothetical protein
VVSGGTVVLLKLQRYAALLGLYALAVGALAARRPRPIAKILAEVTITDVGRPDIAIAYKLAPIEVLNGDWLKATEEFLNRKTPASDLVHARVRHAAAFVTDDAEFDDLFDDAEYLQGLAAMDSTERWGPPGRFMWRRGTYAERGARDGIVTRYGPELVDARMFAGSLERLEEVHQLYEQHLQSIAMYF